MTVTDSVVMKLKTSLEDLAAVQEMAREFLTRHGVGAKTQFGVDLVIEEIVSNILRYAYAKDSAAVGKERMGNDKGESNGNTIDVTVSLAAESVDLNFIDQGQPFNPLEVSEPILPRSLQAARIGGLGIKLVRNQAQRLAYLRRDEQNCLYVSIPLFR
jgi:anti-sigma regulatory factor (Ser/Thr protein kinase)